MSAADVGNRRRSSSNAKGRFGLLFGETHQPCVHVSLNALPGCHTSSEVDHELVTADTMWESNARVVITSTRSSFITRATLPPTINNPPTTGSRILQSFSA